MNGCGNRIRGPIMFNLDGKEKPRNGHPVICGQPYPSDSFPEWTYFCGLCALKAGWGWQPPFLQDAAKR